MTHMGIIKVYHIITNIDSTVYYILFIHLPHLYGTSNVPGTVLLSSQQPYKIETVIVSSL